MTLDRPHQRNCAVRVLVRSGECFALAFCVTYCTDVLPTKVDLALLYTAPTSADTAGIKDIDAVPNSWGFSLNDYKSVLGENYVHGCVPWEDQHVVKANHKQFQKLHSKRVQLLQELHMVEKDIRDLMD